MVLICDAEASDRVMAASLDDGSGSVERTGTWIANSRNRDTADGKVRGADADHLATVAGGVI